MPTVLAFLSQSNRPYSNLIIQLEAVIEVSTSKVVRLRTSPQQVHKGKYLTPTNGTSGQTGFHSGQASYLNMKVNLFAELDITRLAALV